MAVSARYGNERWSRSRSLISPEGANDTQDPSSVSAGYNFPQSRIRPPVPLDITNGDPPSAKAPDMPSVVSNVLARRSSGSSSSGGIGTFKNSSGLGSGSTNAHHNGEETSDERRMRLNQLAYSRPPDSNGGTVRRIKPPSASAYDTSKSAPSNQRVERSRESGGGREHSSNGHWSHSNGHSEGDGDLDMFGGRISSNGYRHGEDDHLGHETQDYGTDEEAAEVQEYDDADEDERWEHHEEPNDDPDFERDGSAGGHTGGSSSQHAKTLADIEEEPETPSSLRGRDSIAQRRSSTQMSGAASSVDETDIYGGIDDHQVDRPEPIPEHPLDREADEDVQSESGWETWDGNSSSAHGAFEDDATGAAAPASVNATLAGDQTDEEGWETDEHDGERSQAAVAKAVKDGATLAAARRVAAARALQEAQKRDREEKSKRARPVQSKQEPQKGAPKSGKLASALSSAKNAAVKAVPAPIAAKFNSDGDVAALAPPPAPSYDGSSSPELGLPGAFHKPSVHKPSERPPSNVTVVSRPSGMTRVASTDTQTTVTKKAGQQSQKPIQSQPVRNEVQQAAPTGTADQAGPEADGYIDFRSYRNNQRFANHADVAPPRAVMMAGPTNVGAQSLTSPISPVSPTGAQESISTQKPQAAHVENAKPITAMTPSAALKAAAMAGWTAVKSKSSSDEADGIDDVQETQESSLPYTSESERASVSASQQRARDLVRSAAAASAKRSSVLLKDDASDSHSQDRSQSKDRARRSGDSDSRSRPSLPRQGSNGSSQSKLSNARSVDDLKGARSRQTSAEGALSPSAGLRHALRSPEIQSPNSVERQVRAHPPSSYFPAPQRKQPAEAASDYGSSKDVRNSNRLSVTSSVPPPGRPPRSPSRDALGPQNPASPPPLPSSPVASPHQQDQVESTESQSADILALSPRERLRRLNLPNDLDSVATHIVNGRTRGSSEPGVSIRSLHAAESPQVIAEGEAYGQSPATHGLAGMVQSPETSLDHGSGRDSGVWPKDDKSRRHTSEDSTALASNVRVIRTGQTPYEEDQEVLDAEAREESTRARSGSLLSFRKGKLFGDGFTMSLGRKAHKDRAKELEKAERSGRASASASQAPSIAELAADRQSIRSFARGSTSNDIRSRTSAFSPPQHPAGVDSERNSLRSTRKRNSHRRYESSTSAIMASAASAQASYVTITSPTPPPGVSQQRRKAGGRHSRTSSTATGASRGGVSAIADSVTAPAAPEQTREPRMRSSKSAPSINASNAGHQAEADAAEKGSRSSSNSISLPSPTSKVLSRLPPVSTDENDFDTLPPVEKYVALAGVLAEMLYPGGKARVQKLANEGVRLQREQRARELEVERLEEKIASTLPSGLERDTVRELHVAFATRTPAKFSKKDAKNNSLDKEQIAELEEKLSRLEIDISRQRSRLRDLAKQRPRLATRLEEERKRFEKMRRVENTLRRLRPEVFLTLGAEAKSEFYRSEDGLQLHIAGGAEGVTTQSEYHGQGGDISDSGHRTPMTTGPSPLEVYGDEGDYAVGLRTSVSLQREAMSVLRSHEKLCYSQLLLAEAALRNCIADILDLALILESPRSEQEAQDDRSVSRRLSFSSSRAEQQRRALTDAQSSMSTGEDIEDDFERVCFLRRKVESRAAEIEQLVRAVSSYYSNAASASGREDLDVAPPRVRAPPSAWRGGDGDASPHAKSRSRKTSNDSMSRNFLDPSDAESDAERKGRSRSNSKTQKDSGDDNKSISGKSTASQRRVAFQAGKKNGKETDANQEANGSGSDSRFSTAPNSPSAGAASLAPGGGDVHLMFLPTDTVLSALALILRIIPALRLLSVPATTPEQLRRSAFRCGQWLQRAQSTLPQLEDAREALDEVIRLKFPHCLVYHFTLHSCVRCYSVERPPA
ncbi:hypothetical protein CBOM_00073 [Ceraceosorus bombacis]|uniref:Uncharacterized protein n=1 Tax=Ceraceosorus bombacis TaxID=401625 RepID=A0A0P1B9S8_9BASI|nr:hypothetical protein CBOM_00073 [Ceraceosorus bombacis]